jgi:hypothetical protein
MVCYHGKVDKERNNQEGKRNILNMQTLSSQHPNNLNPQTRKIAVIAILLFALSGLISGFAVGAFGHSKAKTVTGTAPNTGTRTTPVVRLTHTPVPTTTTEHVNLDLPVIQGDYSSFQIANGSTSYTFSAQIIEKNKQPIQASDVTCKLWLTKEGDVNSILGADNYAIPRTIDNIQQPFPKEVVGAFNYIAPSQQIQPCAPNGKTTWNYTIFQSVDPGIYNLVVLADWRGKSFNWSWVRIEIKKAG